MVKGIGVDIVDNRRIKKLIYSQAFIKRVLTASEQKVFQNLTRSSRKTEYLAGRFASKEAFSKALGSGIGSDFSFQDVSVLHKPTGQPYFKISKKIKTKIHSHLSLSHEKNHTVAFVIIT